MIARLVALLAVLVALPARAAPIDDAKKAFAEGKAAFERGDYEQALSAYQRANMILPAPNLYYNIGATYERLGRFQEAALAFDKFFELAGAPTTDEDKDFQEKLRVRSEADRKRADAPTPSHQQQVQQQPVQQPPRYPQPYYAPAPYYAAAPLQQPREVRLANAKGRHLRAIVLLAVGSGMSGAGIGLLTWAVVDPTLDIYGHYGWGFLGATLFIVGVTLWAPGAASFVKSSHDLKELSEPTPQPQPPTARGF